MKAIPGTFVASAKTWSLISAPAIYNNENKSLSNNNITQHSTEKFRKIFWVVRFVKT